MVWLLVQDWHVVDVRLDQRSRGNGHFGKVNDQIAYREKGVNAETIGMARGDTLVVDP